MGTARVLCLAIALAGIAAPAQPQARGSWRLTPDGYGPARIGMTRAEVERALAIRLRGEPLEDGPDACVEMSAVRGFPDLNFMFEARRLTRISIHGTSRVTTPRGIGVRATAAQVRRAYGPALRAESHH